MKDNIMDMIKALLAGDKQKAAEAIKLPIEQISSSLVNKNKAG